MAKSKRELQDVLSELTAEVLQKSMADVELLLRYSVEHDGWQAKIGLPNEDRWKDAGNPRPLADGVHEAMQPLIAMWAANASRQSKGGRVRRRKQARR